MEPTEPTNEEPVVAPEPTKAETTAPEPTQPQSTQPVPSANRSIIFGILGAVIVAVLAFLLIQANGDMSELQDRLDASAADVTRLTDNLDEASGELTDANEALETAEGVRRAIVDFIAVSLATGGGISEDDGRCVAETMDSTMGTELLLRSSLAAAGLTPNSQDGGQFTSSLAGAAASCGVPLNSGNASPAVSGAALPAFAPTGNDRAIGATAPTVTGVDFEGATVQIGGTGRPTAIVFLAHWCPHCQREVPQVQGWIDATGGVAGVDVIGVASSTDPSRDNYPPWEWLDREGWTQPVLVDDTGNTTMAAFGGTAFPFWVFLNADGTVAARVAGETDIATLEALLQSIAP